MRIRGFKSAAVAALVCGWALAFVSGTGADTPASGEVSVIARLAPRVLRSTGDTRFTVTVEISNRGPATHVWITVGGGPWPDAGATLGGPLRFGLPTLAAPATFGPVYSTPMPAPPPWACARGPTPDSVQFDVAIPALAQTTLTVPIRGLVPSWPGTDYTPRLLWGVQSGNTFRRDQSVRLPRVRMRGPTGVRIRLRARPPASRRGAITIRGTTHPRVRGRVVELGARRALSRDRSGRITLVQIARVMTDSAGRFALRRWKPAAGIYQLRAHILRPGRGLQADSSCGPTLGIDPHHRVSTIRAHEQAQRRAGERR
jgi:hypothetical protein